MITLNMDIKLDSATDLSGLIQYAYGPRPTDDLKVAQIFPKSGTCSLAPLNGEFTPPDGDALYYLVHGFYGDEYVPYIPHKDRGISLLVWEVYLGNIPKDLLRWAIGCLVAIDMTDDEKMTSQKPITIGSWTGENFITWITSGYLARVHIEIPGVDIVLTRFVPNT